MSKLGWFIAGIGLGALGLAQFRDNPKARDAVDELVAAAKDFSQAVVEGFEERESELQKPAAKPAPKKPAAKKPATRKPAAKPATKRPAATNAKPAAKK
jgi:hypothetical protein